MQTYICIRRRRQQSISMELTTLCAYVYVYVCVCVHIYVDICKGADGAPVRCRRSVCSVPTERLFGADGAPVRCRRSTCSVVSTVGVYMDIHMYICIYNIYTHACTCIYVQIPADIGGGASHILVVSTVAVYMDILYTCIYVYISHMHMYICTNTCRYRGRCW